MEQLDFEALNARLNPRLADLVNYIFQVQGAERRRLDYAAAAAALHVEWVDISRGCSRLGKLNILRFIGNELQLNQDLIIDT